MTDVRAGVWARALVGTGTAIVLFAGSTDLHGPPTSSSTLITSSPVLSARGCEVPCDHFDRYEGELTPDHPAMRLGKHLALRVAAPTSEIALTVAPTPRHGAPDIEEPLVGRLLPARAPPPA